MDFNTQDSPAYTINYYYFKKYIVSPAGLLIKNYAKYKSIFYMQKGIYECNLFYQNNIDKN